MVDGERTFLRSNELFAVAQDVLPGGVNSSSRLFPSLSSSQSRETLYISSGSGSEIIDADGQKYVDYHMCAGAALFGHDYRPVREAIALRLREGICFASSHELEVDAGALVGRLFPSVERVRFCNSGSEAVVAALGVSRAYSRKNTIICFEGCFHGWLFPSGFSDVATLPLSDIGVVREYLRLNGNSVAAILIDPCPASNGLIALDASYISELRSLCDRYSIVLVFDEIISGMRLSPSGVQGLLGIRADITVLGKVMGGGMPIGVYGGRENVMSAVAPIGTYRQGGTFSAHPISLTAAKVVLSELLESPPYDVLEKTAARLWGLLSIAIEAAGLDICIARMGSIATLYSGSTPPKSAVERHAQSIPNYDCFHAELIRHGVFIAPGASKSWFVSTVHDEGAILNTVEVVMGALKMALTHEQ